MIRSYLPAQEYQATRTQATAYYESLKNRLESQQRSGVPRSKAAWSAEQNRLGAWNTGVGALRPSGAAAGYISGEGRLVFRFDPEEVERQATTEQTRQTERGKP